MTVKCFIKYPMMDDDGASKGGRILGHHKVDSRRTRINDGVFRITDINYGTLKCRTFLCPLT